MTETLRSGNDDDQRNVDFEGHVCDENVQEKYGGEEEKHELELTEALVMVSEALAGCWTKERSEHST